MPSSITSTTSSCQECKTVRNKWYPGGLFVKEGIQHCDPCTLMMTNPGGIFDEGGILHPFNLSPGALHDTDNIPGPSHVQAPPPAAPTAASPATKPRTRKRAYEDSSSPLPPTRKSKRTRKHANEDTTVRKKRRTAEEFINDCDTLEKEAADNNLSVYSFLNGKGSYSNYTRIKNIATLAKLDEDKVNALICEIESIVKLSEECRKIYKAEY